MTSIRTESVAGSRKLGAHRVELAFALMLASGAGFAQQASELSEFVLEPVLLSAAPSAPLDRAETSAADLRRLERAVDDYMSAIERLRRGDASSPELIEQLAYLALAYQGLERHEEALATLQEAVSLTVRNGGRDNLEQIPLLEQEIVSYRVLDDVKRIDDTEDRIYELKQSGLSPASRDMYYATINLADWNTTAYFRENYGIGVQALRRQRLVIERAPRAIGDTSGGTNEIFSGDIKDVFDADINDARLRRIDRLYKAFQDAVAERGNAQLDIMVDLAKRIARLAYHTKQEMDFERDNYTFDPNYEGSREQEARNSPRRMEESYESGRAALRYAITLLGSVEGVRPEALAAAQLDLGDWHLAYGKSQAATDAYGEAYRALLDAGFSAENVDVALAAAMPPRIPIFATHVYSRGSRGIGGEAELAFEGYVDVSYAIDALGNASDIQLLDSSQENSTLVANAIKGQLSSAKFRPTLRGGELHSPGRVEARYFYAY